MREQLAEDAALADAAGDQLRVLPAEVEDQDLLGRLGGRRLLDLAELRLGAGTLRSGTWTRAWVSSEAALAAGTSEATTVDTVAA